MNPTKDCRRVLVVVRAAQRDRAAGVSVTDIARTLDAASNTVYKWLAA